MIQANGITYALLLVLILVGFRAPRLSGPMVRLTQPINEALIGSVFWVIEHVSGKEKKESPLLEAVEAGDLKKAQKLIANGANTNQTNSHGFTALFIAAGRGDEKMTQLLLNSGADVNGCAPQTNETPLHRAAQWGSAPIVRLLVAAGARVEDTDGSGWTPLFMATLSGKLDVIEELLAAGANVNARSASGWTPLKEAQMRGYKNVADRLKLAGAIDFHDGSR
jgi:ankyrin repeat protein